MLTIVHDGVPHKVPCGKCGFCLQAKRSSWMFRIYYEMRNQLHKGWFLTMTYNEQSVKRTPSGKLSLRFRDVQLYLKRIRKAKYYAKYICVGEYGSITKRPHYHMLLWTDAPVGFLQVNWKRSNDNKLLGHIQFGELNMQSAMYTLKYIIQPKHKWSDDDLRENTRAQFSKGLGLSYMTTEMYNYHSEPDDQPNFFAMVDGQRVALPRYYRDKIFTSYEKALHRNQVLDYVMDKEQKELERARSLGVTDAKAYLFGLRSEQARRIISKTKFTEKL